jgi:lipopolysaccharide export system protein LptA
MHKWPVLLMLIGMPWLCLGAERQSEPGGLKTLLPTQDCEEAEQTLDVTSERMTFDSQTHTFIFEDNVQVRRCRMTMRCDRLHVTQNATNERVERIVAIGNVHFQQGERQATAERAEYFEAEQKLVLTGNPRAWNTQEQNELTGEEMVVFLQEEKLLVKRARVLFHPRQEPSKTP